MQQNYLLFALKANVGVLMHEEYVGTIGGRRMEVSVCKKKKNLPVDSMSSGLLTQKA